MKSLEHIIREIREGKATEKGKKTSLEHSIRKVVKGEAESSFADRTTKPLDEDVGGLIGSGTGGEPKLHAEDGKKKKTDEAVGIIGTDDYKGRQFNTTVPHIEPPDGTDRNIQVAKTASRSRIAAKERASLTMHGKVTEGKLSFADPIVKGAEELFAKVAPKSNLPAIFKQKGMPAKPKVEVPAKLEPPKVEPKTEVPSKVEPKTETPPKVDTTTKVEPKTEVPSKVEPKTETPPKVDTTTKAPNIQPTKAEVPTTKTLPQAAEVPATKVSPETKTAVATTTDKPKAAGIGGVSGTHDSALDVMLRLFNPKTIHKAKAHHKHHEMKEASEPRKEIENMPRKGDRKTIEYVGRKDSDAKTVKQKTSRLATIKNVIDEAKKNIEAKKIRTEDGKTKAYDYGEDVLVINPDQRRVNLDVDNGEKVPNDYK